MFPPRILAFTLHMQTCTVVHNCTDKLGKSSRYLYMVGGEVLGNHNHWSRPLSQTDRSRQAGASQPVRCLPRWWTVFTSFWKPEPPVWRSDHDKADSQFSGNHVNLGILKMGSNGVVVARRQENVWLFAGDHDMVTWWGTKFRENIIIALS